MTDDRFARLLKRISLRAYNALQREGWCSAEDMRRRSYGHELLDIRSFGMRSLAATVVALQETQGAALPEWVIDWCVDHAEQEWWAEPYATERRKLRALESHPRLETLRLAVIEAARTWRQDGKWDDTPLENAIDALNAFEKEEQ